MRRSEPAAGDRPRHLAIVGPTASGKSALGLAVARALGDSEIVSLDSMQVYRGMDIGTAKSPAGERSDVVHHVVDVADPAEEWSVVRTQAAVRGAIDSIEARGRRAVLVGGTGLYVRAVVDGITVPAEDAGVRSALEAEWQGETGLASAYDELAARDPEAAARIEPGNRRRIIRALEVMRVTGRPFSAFGRGSTTTGRRRSTS
ncbi:MAG: tRNA (adenosine(37)-N6)-dimethylallyltransferase MiaA [Acidimicrobiia bacterium]|nr:tRNA (adenosine(37)-N6)-dimethylallyltransferase MiaA [Acidimicrobiia bacterium]